MSVTRWSLPQMAASNAIRKPIPISSYSSSELRVIIVAQQLLSTILSPAAI